MLPISALIRPLIPPVRRLTKTRGAHSDTLPKDVDALPPEVEAESAPQPAAPPATAGLGMPPSAAGLDHIVSAQLSRPEAQSAVKERLRLRAMTHRLDTLKAAEDEDQANHTRSL